MSDRVMEEELSPGERLHRAQNLMEAIAECEWEDAELVMSTILHEFRSGRPLPPFGEVEDEAEFWASIATYDELLAYFIESGKRLGNRKLGNRGRIKMVERIMDDLSAEDIRKIADRAKSLEDSKKVA